MKSFTTQTHCWPLGTHRYTTVGIIIYGCVHSRVGSQFAPYCHFRSARRGAVTLPVIDFFFSWFLMCCFARAYNGDKYNTCNNNIIIDKRPDAARIYRYLQHEESGNLYIILFFSSSSSSSQSPSSSPSSGREGGGTLDAKSLGHGLTRSRCVHVRPTVSNRLQTTAATVYNLWCSINRAAATTVFRPRKNCMTGKNDGFLASDIDGGKLYIYHAIYMYIYYDGARIMIIITP